jgi:hypothetical protein
MGYLPSLYHRFVLGDFAKSGIKLIKFSEEFWLNAKILFLHSSDFLVGSEFQVLSILVSLFGIGVVFFSPRKMNPFWILGPIILVGFLSSRSVCEPFSLRYILAFHLVLSVSLGTFSCYWLEKRKVAGIFFILMWLGLGIYSNWRAPNLYRKQPLYTQLTRWEDIRELVGYLEQEQIRVGYSDYWPAYLANFMTQERIILEPLYTNYLPFYGKRVKEEVRAVLIKDKGRLSAGPDMSESPKEVRLNETIYRVVGEKDFENWHVWQLERVS